MKKPKLNENRIKIRYFNFTSIMWMNKEILCFIVIFYVASLAAPQICGYVKSLECYVRENKSSCLFCAFKEEQIQLTGSTGSRV